MLSWLATTGCSNAEVAAGGGGYQIVGAGAPADAAAVAATTLFGFADLSGGPTAAGATVSAMPIAASSGSSPAAVALPDSTVLPLAVLAPPLLH